MQSVTEPNDWENRYQEGTTPWDLGEAAPPLESLLNSSRLPVGRAVVLGCGRGYDALLFARYGFETIGVDLAPSAIASATSLANATGSTAQFLQRDIFDLPAEFPNYFDYIVEHTCFCAISPEQRTAYVQLVRSLLKPKGELIGLFFTHNRPGGPPFGITPVEIRHYFETDFEILSLEPVTNSIPKRQGEEHLGRFRLK
ncbi:TPMT family class I SAM-dependent methyltransferase [Funiculus sociatus GB2-A5]|uniref:TPMT family class I SAM-dependent methyltransferase n=1 Tax=Funiculus sociatus GB2-A5 TaxID=2933946 RepID=A0ABV0JNA9_9CYAN|nr:MULTISPECIES: methyltransferase domain-containing protein [unclassified Trichocoleus]MBD1904219.1 methyltransferase domain-containing protein [Trichocoleus sp. FACHB-832]MBD2064125.1 methyltransferase domain-containing protein [Trichocoleus sp. FACHB-6]